MLRFIFLAVLVWILYRLVKGVMGPSKEIHQSKGGGVIDEMVQDPFCKTYIPRREALKKVIHGKDYLFCSNECAERFEAGETR